MQVKNLSDIPRDRMQISNFHRISLSNSNSDDLAARILKCKEQSAQDVFSSVREVGATPEVYVFWKTIGRSTSAQGMRTAQYWVQT